MDARVYWQNGDIMIDVTCKGCGAEFTTDDEFAGQKTTCPECDRPLTIPVRGSLEDVDLFEAVEMTCPACGENLPTVVEDGAKEMKCPWCNTPFITQNETIQPEPIRREIDSVLDFGVKVITGILKDIFNLQPDGPPQTGDDTSEAFVPIIDLDEIDEEPEITFDMIDVLEDEITLSPEKLSEDDQAMLALACFLSRFMDETDHLNANECELVATICGEVGENINLTDVAASLHNLSSNFELFNEVVQQARADREFRTTLLKLGWRVASRHNRIDESEKLWLVNMARRMGASDEESNRVMSLYCRLLDIEADRLASLNVLNLQPTATDHDVTKRYRELARKYHPDLHSTSNPTLMELVQKEFVKIKEAYDSLIAMPKDRYWGLASEQGGITIPESMGVVQCFLCGTKCRLPDKSRFRSTRCPRCKAFLLFTKDLAKEFANECA